MPIRRQETKKIVEEIKVTRYECAALDCDFSSEDEEKTQRHEKTSHVFYEWHNKERRIIRFSSYQNLISWMPIGCDICAFEQGYDNADMHDLTSDLIRDLKDKQELFPLTFYYESDEFNDGYGTYAVIKMWKLDDAIVRAEGKIKSCKAEIIGWEWLLRHLQDHLDDKKSSVDPFAGWVPREVMLQLQDLSPIALVVFDDASGAKKYSRFDLGKWIFLDPAPDAKSLSEELLNAIKFAKEVSEVNS